MRLQLPIGISDFRELREKGLEYIDKSGLLVEMIDRAGTKVFLLPRPRRFGKTLNLTMIRYYFEKRQEDLSHLFQDLAVWRAGEEYRQRFQRYPVISLTFGGMDAATYEACWAKLRAKIENLFLEHWDLLSSGVLKEREAADYRAVMDGRAEGVRYRHALADLTRYLRRATGERVIVLIDEYDEPIRTGFMHGYAREVIDILGCFLTAGLKDNPDLEHGVLTGTLRIPLASTLSGLDNLAVHTLLDDLINASLRKHGARLRSKLDVLLRGEGFEEILNENVVLDRVDKSDVALWSMLVFSGYLRAKRCDHGLGEQASHFLSIPNREVRLVYADSLGRPDVKMNAEEKA